ncbi:inhibitor of Bruton tyrosine kinase [Agrilus planipennis]|uniref:Inhibitor of Bruton tyrosine kinase n=1 Tax=Agrilus planipennis TaxID=224129 RepID=A0A7F5RNN6_AGRPL|nr:inhibitor of Bruton tyrosine kinase [Agrilus planipennis]
MSDTPDCTERCSSEIHGDILCAALTKREVTDYQLCAFLSKTCYCCGTVKDSLGRTSLHIAASCGRTNIVKWLINYKHANINVKDIESGYTPLHRSIYYGKIHTAISLLKMGACIDTSDLDGLTVLEHAMKDLQLPLEPCISNSGEIYVWGQNTNYTLGPHQARSLPERLDLFYKENPDVEICCVCLEKFHSILLTRDGKVFASGHGQGGRLGLSTEETVLLPKQVRFGKAVALFNIKQISIARDHSVFLNENGQNCS